MRGTTIALAMALGSGLTAAAASSASAAPTDLAPLPLGGGDHETAVVPPLAPPPAAAHGAGDAHLLPDDEPATHPRPIRFAPPPRDLTDSPMIPLPPAVLAGPAALALAGMVAMRARRRGGRL